jgi:hypothetical protein
MLVALLAAAAASSLAAPAARPTHAPPPTTAVDAERAFAHTAQTIGQWTAFRTWADPTAVMWVPQAVWAQEWLKDRADPPTSVRWWPSHSWQSCDRRTAVNVGPWEMGGDTGRFITLWMRQQSGAWRWAADGQLAPAGRLKVPRRAVVRTASCANPRLRTQRVAADYARPINRTAAPGDSGYARSADGTLLFNWTVAADGVRRTRVQFWRGNRFVTVHDEVTRP